MKHNLKYMLIAALAIACTAVSCDSYFDINTKDQATLEDIMSRSTAVRQYLAHLYAYIPNDENLRANEGGTSLRSDEALHAKSQYETNWYKVRRAETIGRSTTKPSTSAPPSSTISAMTRRIPRNWSPRWKGKPAS